MKPEIKQHIKLLTEHPLDARLTEKPFKVHMVARLAFTEGVEACVEQYGLSLGAIYAAMSFYEDNREAIEQASDEAWEDIRETGTSSTELAARIKERMKQADTPKSS